MQFMRWAAGVSAVVLSLVWTGARTARADFLAASGIGDEIIRFHDNGNRAGSFILPGSGGLNSPFSMTYGPDGNLYVGGNYIISSSVPAHGAIYVYNGKTGAFIRKIDSPAASLVYGLHFLSDGELLVSASPGGGPGSVYRMDPASGQIIARMSDPRMIAPGHLLELPDGRVIVGSTSGLEFDKILALDLQTSTVTGIFAQGAALAGALGMQYGPDGMIYAANLYHNKGIVRIDPQTGTILDTFALVPGGNPSISDLSFAGGNRLWASDIIHGSMYEFDATTGAYLGTTDGVAFCYALQQMPEPEPIPEPGAIALLAAGCGLLMAGNRWHHPQR